MTTEETILDSPLGPVRAVVRAGKLCALRLAEAAGDHAAVAARPGADPAGIATALAAYFRGDLDAVARVEVDPDGTPFQRRVWAALRAIPAGTTASYGEIARALGMPGAARAVGAANRANPIWIVVPCHRVIGASGALTGYAAGLGVKRWLLAHERAHGPGRGAS